MVDFSGIVNFNPRAIADAQRAMEVARTTYDVLKSQGKKPVTIQQQHALQKLQCLDPRQADCIRAQIAETDRTSGS